MNTDIDRALFERELAGGTVRGLPCAGPSTFWAYMSGFTHPGEIAAMIAGTVVWLAGFAWFASSVAMQATAERERFVRALKMSAWLKAGSLLGVEIIRIAEAALKTKVRAVFALGVLPDMWAGLGSVSLVGWLAGVKDLNVAQLDSFGGTLLATLVQGTLVSLVLVGLAPGMFAWWRAWPWLRRISPARIAGREVCKALGAG